MLCNPDLVKALIFMSQNLPDFSKIIGTKFGKSDIVWFNGTVLSMRIICSESENPLRGA